MQAFYVLIVFVIFKSHIKNRFKDKHLTATYNLIVLNLTLKALEGRGWKLHPLPITFLLITSEIERFSTRNFVTFLILNVELGQNKKNSKFTYCVR